MFCFDTDIVAAALLREPPMQLVRRLGRTPASEQCTTAVTVAELTYGAARGGDADAIPRLRELITAAQTVIPFDEDAAEVYGTLRAQLEQVGVRLDEPSLRIASIAVAHDMTLVTGSARLYDRVPGLRIENWLEPDELDALVDEIAEGPETRDDELAWTNGDGTVRHPGVVPSLEARARAAAERAARPADETTLGR
jgi:tRNA(fMet)-specific endonuclease VapC